MDKTLTKLLEAIKRLRESADDTGCTDDMIVVSAQALNEVTMLTAEAALCD